MQGEAAADGRSPRLHQKSTGQNLSIFYRLRKQWYIIAAGVYHHAKRVSYQP